MVSRATKAITAELSERAFTTSEVGAMLGLEAVEVNNLIDEIAHLQVVQTGGRKRTVGYRGLLAMLVARELVYCQLRPTMRSPALAAALRLEGKRIPVPGTNLEIEVESYRRQVNRGLRLLHEAEAAVESNAAILQGEPCLKGTRVPVYTIAAIAAARGVDEALATFPFLKRQQVELAITYSKAHPRKGRPKRIAFPTGGKIVSRKVIHRTKQRSGA